LICISKVTTFFKPRGSEHEQTSKQSIEADLGDRSNATPVTFQTRSGRQFVVTPMAA
jgi:hypothetical protein